MTYETALADFEAEMVSGRVTRLRPETVAALVSALTDELHTVLLAHGHTMDQVSDTGTRMALTPAERANIASAAAAIDLKAPLASPSFTGTPTAPTAVAGTNTTQLATTAFVAAAVAALLNSAPGALDTLDELAAALGDDANFATTVTNLLALKAPLASPSLTGTPTAPTAAPGTNTTQLATTAFAAALAALKAPLDSPSFTGTPTAPTQATSDDTTKLATTAFVKAVVAAMTAGVASFNTRTGAVTLASGDVTGALGFTPLSASAYTAADVLAKLLTVDGSGSGVDSDSVDGIAGSSIVRTVNGTGPDGAGNVTVAAGVQDVRLGASSSFGAANSSTPSACATGHVITKQQTYDGGNLYYSTLGTQRPIQKQVSGTWTTVSQV